MLGTCSPANTILFVSFDTSAAVLLRKKLQTIVVDEDVGSTTLHFVGSNGGIDTADGGNNDSLKTFLVDWHLDGEVRKTTLAVP